MIANSKKETLAEVKRKGNASTVVSGDNDVSSQRVYANGNDSMGVAAIGELGKCTALY